MGGLTQCNPAITPGKPHPRGAFASKAHHQLRNSVIQCFEFTYELSWKMLKRHLEATSASPADLDQAHFQDLIREGNVRGLLRSDWLRWKTYRQARNDSGHTCNQAKAEMVFAMAPDFLAEAQALYQALTRHAA